MNYNKWTTSLVKANLYNKYRAEWLQTHDFDFVCIYKKFNEYLQKNNLEASNDSFDSFQDECCDANMWMQFWDWESEILIPQIQDGILLLIDDDYELLFDISTIYLYDAFEDEVSIGIKSIGVNKKSLAEMAYDIAEAIVNYEHSNEVVVFSDASDDKRKLDKMVDRIIRSAYSVGKHKEV